MLSDKGAVSEWRLGTGLVGREVGTDVVGIGVGLLVNPVGKGMWDKRDTLNSAVWSGIGAVGSGLL